MIKIFVLSIAAFVGSNAVFAGTPGPCEQIVQTCKSAGFVQGEVKQGKGLWMDCVNPIIQGKAVKAAITVPTVDPTIVSACKAKHPKFGEGKVAK